MKRSKGVQRREQNGGDRNCFSFHLKETLGLRLKSNEPMQVTENYQTIEKFNVFLIIIWTHHHNRILSYSFLQEHVISDWSGALTQLKKRTLKFFRVHFFYFQLLYPLLFLIIYEKKIITTCTLNHKINFLLTHPATPFNYAHFVYHFFPDNKFPEGFKI